MGFPALMKAVENGNFDADSTQKVIRTLRDKPDACQKILNLKNPDGTPRFTPEEVGTLILNCRNFLETDRLMMFMTTPKADEIWRGYVDSDEFKDLGK